MPCYFFLLSDLNTSLASSSLLPTLFLVSWVPCLFISTLSILFIICTCWLDSVCFYDPGVACRALTSTFSIIFFLLVLSWFAYYSFSPSFWEYDLVGFFDFFVIQSWNTLIARLSLPSSSRHSWSRRMSEVAPLLRRLTRALRIR